MRAGAHARPGAVAVVRCAGAVGHVEVALGEEGIGVFEVRGVVVGGPSVLQRGLVSSLRFPKRRMMGPEPRRVVGGGRGAYHVERCAGRDRCFLPVDVLCADAWKAHGDDGPEAEDFFDESGEVGDFFFRQAVFPCVAVGVHFHDLFVGALLDFLAVR